MSDTPVVVAGFCWYEAREIPKGYRFQHEDYPQSRGQENAWVVLDRRAFAELIAKHIAEEWGPLVTHLPSASVITAALIASGMTAPKGETNGP